MSNTSSAVARRVAPSTRNPDEQEQNSQMVVASGSGRSEGQGSMSLVKLIGAVGTVALTLWMTYGYQYETPIDPLDFKSRTDRVLATTPLIDGHNDLPYLLRIELKNKIYENGFKFHESKCI